MYSISTDINVPLALLDLDVLAGATQRSNVYANAEGTKACSVELRVTLLGGGPVNLVVRYLGQNSTPAADPTRLLPLDVKVPDTSALSAAYASVFILPVFTPFGQLEVQNVSGGNVHVQAFVQGCDADFVDAPSAAAGTASLVQLAAGSADAGTFHVYALPPHQAQSGGALVAQAQAYAAPCTLDTVVGYNASPSLAYVQLHDKATAISPGDVPKIVIPVPGGRTSFSLSMPYAFAAGMSIGISTTELTYTSAGSMLAYESVVRA